LCGWNETSGKIWFSLFVTVEIDCCIYLWGGLRRRRDEEETNS